MRRRGFCSAVWNLAAVHRPLHAIRNAPTTIPALHELAARHKPSMRERENMVPVDNANGTIGAAANGRGDVKDTTTLTHQCGST